MYKSDKEQKQHAEEIRKARQNIISKFNESADYISRQLMQGAEKCLAESVDKLISECDKDIKKLQARTSDAQIKNEKLNSLLKRTENLIGEIQAYK